MSSLKRGAVWHFNAVLFYAFGGMEIGGSVASPLKNTKMGRPEYSEYRRGHHPVMYLSRLTLSLYHCTMKTL